MDQPGLQAWNTGRNGDRSLVSTLMWRSQTLMFISHSQHEYSDQTLTSTGNQLSAKSTGPTALQDAETRSQQQDSAGGQNRRSTDLQWHSSAAQRPYQPDARYDRRCSGEEKKDTGGDQGGLLRSQLTKGSAAHQEHHTSEQHH